MGDEKTCSKCKRNLPLTTKYFSRDKHKKSGFTSQCKRCRNENKQSPECEKKYQRKYNDSEKGKINRRKQQLAKYGLTEQDYKILYENQHKKCAICKKELPYSNTNVHIDHNQETGKVRGILCQQCNVGLGFFQDNLDLLIAATNYLQREGTTYCKGDLLVITWLDIVENPEWKPLSMIELQSLPLCKSIGWFSHETAKFICLLPSVNGTEETGIDAGYILIPQAVIRNIEVIREDEIDCE